MQIATATITGLTASATAITTVGRMYGAGNVLMNGTLKNSDYLRNAIATAQSATANVALTLDGVRSSGGYGYPIAPANFIVLYSADNDSAATWTITGLADDMVTAQSETLQAGNISSIISTKRYGKILSVKLSSNSAANVEVGVQSGATLTQPRRIVLTSGGDDSGKTFTITGTNADGAVQSESVVGASGARVSYLTYKTVTSIYCNGATASTLTVGTAADSATDTTTGNGAAHSRWVRLDTWAPGNTAIQCTVSGTVNYTIQSTLDDPNSPYEATAPTSVTWVNSSDANVVAATTSQQSNFLFSPLYARILLTSGSGTVTARFVQGSVVPI